MRYELVYSRRISKNDRLIYDIYEEKVTVLVLTVEGHYDEHPVILKKKKQVCWQSIPLVAHCVHLQTHNIFPTNLHTYRCI